MSVARPRSLPWSGVLPALPASADGSTGTNGWLSCWGTNAHGEMAGCPPPSTDHV